MRRDAITQKAFDPAIVAATLDALLVRPPARRPMIVGLSGLQGCGKSTFARQLAQLARTRKLHCEVLSLDDFYRGRRERARLARDIHPLLATRGVPGTHDVGLLQHTLDALTHANARAPARVPRFDKGLDTRVPPSRWRRVRTRPDLILLEGWCVGVPAQTPNALRRAVNTLERDEDRDGRWRRHVNTELAGPYSKLWRRLHRLVLLQAPNFAIVTQWRNEQERGLRMRGAPRAMSESALARFLLHYERLSRHALRVLPARADVCVVLDARRGVRALKQPRRIAS